MTLQYIALASLPSIADGIVAGGTEQPESLCLPGYCISERLAMVSVVLSHAQLRIANTTAVSLGFILRVPHRVGERSSSRLE